MIPSKDLKPPSRSLHLASSPPFGILSLSVSDATGIAGCALTEVRREAEPSLVEEGKGHLHYVLGGSANMLEQQKAKEELQPKVDILYEEGVIVLSSHYGPACCKDLLGCVCREAGLQHLLNPPVIKAENWESSAYLRGLRQAAGLREGTFFQPASRQHSCCAWETEGTDRCCFEMQSFPPHSQRTIYSAEPSRKPLLTEYQTNYSAGVRGESGPNLRSSRVIFTIIIIIILLVSACFILHFESQPLF
ncbi:hypothetical protein PAMA_014004 [Pampus argenteus]